ncbi:MAG: LamG-like jellyroll fold domain-containing protein, partial [Lentisphaeria bacterium]|nr:LamG-like jellyroll fold domain-containing protein [Lentisphaeria bacterium]
TAGRRDIEATDGSLVFGSATLAVSLDEVRLWQTEQADLAGNTRGRYPDAIREQRSMFLTSTAANWSELSAYFRFDDSGAYPEDATRSFAGQLTLAERSRAEQASLSLSAAAVVEVASDKHGDATFTYLRADSDGDGIPDFWELKHFASLNAAGINAAGRSSVDGSAWWTDADEDGVNDYYEFLMGFDPVSSDDSAQLAVVQVNGLTLAQSQFWRVNPNLADYDDDGVTDKDEVADWYVASADNHFNLSNPRYSITRNTTAKSLSLGKMALDTPNGLEVPFSRRFRGMESMTFEAWYKGDALDAGFLLNYRGATENFLTLNLNASGQATVRAWTTAGILQVVNTNYTLQGSSGEWHHLAAVLDREAGSISLIIDGLAVITKELAAAAEFWPAEKFGRLIIGGNGVNDAQQTSGLLDEVRIWGYARSLEQIGGEQMRLASDIQAPGLLAYYRFDDGGESIEDFTRPFPGSSALPYALKNPASSGSTADWLVADGAPVAHERPGFVPNWWTDMYATSVAFKPNSAEFNRHYYELVDQRLSWDAANAAALAAGGQLPIISSSAENDFIASTLLQGSKGAWMGLADEVEEGYFVWNDGTPLSGSGYSNWSHGQTLEPNNGFWGGADHGPENYAFLVGAAKTNDNLVVSFWNDARNNEQYGDVDSYVVEYGNLMNYIDGRDADWDGDGLNNWYEYLAGTNPNKADTNRDGVLDGAEKLGAYPQTNLLAQDKGALLVKEADADTDDDGLTDNYEFINGHSLSDSRDPLVYRELVLKADSYVNLPADQRYQAETFCLEAWIRPDSNASGVIIERQIESGKYNYHLELTAEGWLRLSFATAAGPVVESSNPMLPLVRDGNTWTHIAVSFARAFPAITDPGNSDYHKYQVQFAINGQNANSAVASILPKQNLPLRWAEGPVHTTIGSRGGNSLKGAIFSVRIWTVGRPLAEIAANYDADFPSDMSGLAALFLFDDGGESIENYAETKDWLSGWRHAARIESGNSAKVLECTQPPTEVIGENGLPLWWQLEHFGHTNVDPEADADGDGLNNYYEYLVGSDPNKQETLPGTNDADADADGDGLINLQEQLAGTDPLSKDSDDDGKTDKEEIDDGSYALYSMSRDGFAPASLALENVVGDLDLPLTAAEKAAGLPQWTLEFWLKGSTKPAADLPLLSRLVSVTEFDTETVNGVQVETSKLVERLGFELGLAADGKAYVKFENAKGLAFAGLQSAYDLLDGAWHHLAATWDGALLRLIADGVSLSEWELTAAEAEMIPADGPYTLTLGGAGTTGLYLDELRLWNLARSHQEIAENAALLQSAGRPGLLRSFRFDDGGSSIEDFANPAPRGWQRLSQTAIQGAGATWSDNTETAPLRGMDDLNDNGIADWWEALHFGRLLQPGEENEDFDQDGLSNLYEFLCGTNPVSSTDKSDYNALSADGEMTNGEKQFYGLDPRLADTDADGISDADEVESFLKRLGLEGKTIAQLKANVLV